MLWDIIRDFFVQYVFGGTMSNGDSFFGVVGKLTTTDVNLVQDDYYNTYFNDIVVKVGQNMNTDGNGVLLNSYIGLSDWLSTTATIITLCLLVAFLFLCVRWLFKLVAGLFTLRG